MAIKLYMKPRAVDFGDEESGIRRVVEAYEKYLPSFGYEFVDNRKHADLSIGHASILPDPDVLVCHGLYWTADYGTQAPKWELNSNREIVEAVRFAKQVTVTSSWVRESFQRDMRLSPTVVPHGIDWDRYQHIKPIETSGYVLWNKNRSGIDVCSTDDMERLAASSKDTLFLSTFANANNNLQNLRVIGLQPHDQMARYVASAGVYLSTVKETFGIGILEAMACGVPVLGWHGGGIEDLVKHGVNGYLARRGDFASLKEGLEYCKRYRETLGANGREMAKAFTWEKGVEKLHYVLQTALEEKDNDVSVIIPCYNLSHKLENAINSVQAQTYQATEIIVVDDGSEESHAARAKEICERHGVTYIRKSNGGVATARNAGIAASHTRFVCCLDADDAIAPAFLMKCVSALSQDRSLSLAYTGLMTVKQDGRMIQSQWPGDYDYDEFLKRKNQVPTCCVYTRDMWERLGGYNQKYAPTGAGTEDAEFFLRAGAYGFVAKRVTSEPLFLYSIGIGHTSKPGYREVDWTYLHPWVKDGQHPFASLASPKNGFSHPVRQYDEPIVSVIIPVGPGHAKQVVDALDSLESQTFRKWEAVVVWDCGEGEGEMMRDIEIAYPYIRSVVTKGGIGAGAARNIGVEKSRGGLLIFLDADDWLYPEALKIMYETWNAVGGIVYSDYVGKAFVSEEFAKQMQNEGRLLAFNENTGEAVMSHRSAEYNCERAQRQPDESDMYIWNLITSMFPRSYHDEIGGFDESMESWEDWDYWIRMAREGKCFSRIADTLVVYRFHTGNRRETGLQQYPHLLQYLKDKYNESSGEVMPCTSCGNRNAVTQNTPKVVSSPDQQVGKAMTDSDFVLILYSNPNLGQHGVIGPATKMNYGYRGGGDRFYVHKSDIAARPDFFVPVERQIEETPVSNRVLNPPESIAEAKAVDYYEEEKEEVGDDEEAPVKIEIAKDDPTDLQKIPGVSDAVQQALNLAGVHTIDDLKNMPYKQIVSIKGIGIGRAKMIRDYLDSLK